MKAMNSGKPPLYSRRRKEKVIQVLLRPSRKRKAEYDHVTVVKRPRICNKRKREDNITILTPFKRTRLDEDQEEILYGLRILEMHDAACHDATDTMCPDATDTICPDATDTICLDATDTRCLDGTDTICLDDTDTIRLDPTDRICLDDTDTICLDATDTIPVDDTNTICLDAKDSVCDDTADIEKNVKSSHLGSIWFPHSSFGLVRRSLRVSKLGSSWVAHPKHGLLRRSGRIAASSKLQASRVIHDCIVCRVQMISASNKYKRLQ
jgi:hypothetical protein